MKTVRSVAALRAEIARWRGAGLGVALVPTMGALHQGHLSLVSEARSLADRVVSSLFVNPTQFGPNEDLAAYPRDEAADARMLAGQGCDLLYAPDLAEMYPPGFSTEVRVAGLTDVLCGASRPGHFDGVAQVVSKLLIQAFADTAVFGQKDWQQLTVIRRLARDLDIPTVIHGAPTVREADGLAMSSRNRYLDGAQRTRAGRINALMREAIERLKDGGDARSVEAALTARLAALPADRVDYVELRDPDTLERRSGPARPGDRLFVAAVIGRARLIDNMEAVPVRAEAHAG
ncbi:MAG: pantoate--beta-alanine ligase [Pseudomonadota bacterium]